MSTLNSHLLTKRISFKEALLSPGTAVAFKTKNNRWTMGIIIHTQPQTLEIVFYDGSADSLKGWFSPEDFEELKILTTAKEEDNIYSKYKESTCNLRGLQQQKKRPL